MNKISIVIVNRQLLLEQVPGREIPSKLCGNYVDRLQIKDFSGGYPAVILWMEMATYLLISLNGSGAAVDAAVGAKFPTEALQIESGKWLISSSQVTTKEVSESLEIPDAQTYFVVPVKGYFGVARPQIWEWLSNKTTVNA